MKKLLPIVVIVLIVLGAGAYLLTKNGKNDDMTPSANTTDTSQTPTTNSITQPATANAITIANMSFSPNTISVKKGTTVTWTNQDSANHTVTETDGKDGPMSQNLAKGETYSFTFTTVGTFAYACSIHPSMMGSVTVTE